MFLFALLLTSQNPILSSAKAPQRVARVVSVSPALTEIICAIGACERLVGVSRFCDEPEQVKALPKVGGFVDPSVEATLALRPDLVVLTTNGANKPFTEALDKARVAWVAFRDETLDDYAVIVKALGESLGLQARAKEAIAQFERDLALIASQPKVGASALVVYGHAPLIVAGPETFGAEMLARVGAKNAYDGKQRYPTIDFETLLRLKPAWIIDVDMLADHSADTAYYQPIRAMLEKNGTRFVFAPDPALLRLGPRLPNAMLALRLGLK
jgi:iron complex transport system substrate-binding protein